jgi:DUF1009 family protein
LGIIAGAGRFPFLVAEGAHRAGRSVAVIGLRGLTDPTLREHADRFCWSGVVRLGRWIRVFRRWRVSEAVMAGSVRKSEMYGRFRMVRYLPDWTSIRLWFFEVADRRNDTILRATADHLQRKGITLTSSVRYCREHLPGPGVLTRQVPSLAQEQDIAFGWHIAREMGRLDIGQSVAVKEREVIAVEAIEGTDRMIARAGELCRSGGWMLIKVAKPEQDPRFDVPTVGPETIDNLAAHGGNALVFEAHRTLVIDREELVRRAERRGVIVVARADEAMADPGGS